MRTPQCGRGQYFVEIEKYFQFSWSRFFTETWKYRLDSASAFNYLSANGYLDAANPKSHYFWGSCSDLIFSFNSRTNNSLECFNRLIGEIWLNSRILPVLRLLEVLRTDVIEMNSRRGTSVAQELEYQKSEKLRKAWDKAIEMLRQGTHISPLSLILDTPYVEASDGHFLASDTPGTSFVFESRNPGDILDLLSGD